ncbi:flagellar export protein FliJ [Aquibacillus sediminis]|uniref:flagellar export protein FliJ n=1 Tax=Aquibacillus sediminis TaxID=2574734 RepID=UPI0011086677|nr:flagellar export protein FliJ [Aquibacillus sediminis]
MADIETFQKLLVVRERDKNLAKKNYQQSVQFFENLASELYQLLKNKEDAEKEYQQQLANTSSVTMLSHYSLYIQRIKTKIGELQSSVNQARQEMNDKQQQLTEAHIEVKKFEKIIEKKRQTATFKQKHEENKFMDEITVTQFINSKR